MNDRDVFGAMMLATACVLVALSIAFWVIALVMA